MQKLEQVTSTRLCCLSQESEQCQQTLSPVLYGLTIMLQAHACNRYCATEHRVVCRHICVCVGCCTCAEWLLLLSCEWLPAGASPPLQPSAAHPLAWPEHMMSLVVYASCKAGLQVYAPCKAGLYVYATLQSPSTYICHAAEPAGIRDLCRCMHPARPICMYLGLQAVVKPLCSHMLLHFSTVVVIACQYTQHR